MKNSMRRFFGVFLALVLICGMIPAAALPVSAASTFDITSSNIVLGNELAMYFYVPKASLQGEDYVAVVTKSYADGRADVVVEIPYSQWEAASNNRMRFKFDGIAAKEMSDNITAVIKNSAGVVLSNPYTDSIRGYVERGFAGGNAQKNAKLATMLVDMLNYGAAAQEMFNYGLKDPANKNMAAYQKDYATETVSCSNNQVKGNGYRSVSLSLESNIAFNMFFEKEYVNQTMTAVVTFTDHYGKEKEVRIGGSEFEDRGTKGWMVPVNALVVADARQMVTCSFLDAGGKPVTGVSGQDSIESFCARAIAGGGGDYYEYIMKFCSAAYSYFHEDGETSEPSVPDMTYEQYIQLSAAEQAAFRKTFGSTAEFFEWYQAAKAEYEAQNPEDEVGDGSIDLGDIMNGGSKP